MRNEHYGFCSRCGGKEHLFYVLAPDSDEPKWVCDDCEHVYVRQRDYAQAMGKELARMRHKVL